MQISLVIRVTTCERTSRYYRKVTEPFVYKDLVISSGDTRAVKSLILTLVNRNELAIHITTAILTRQSGIYNTPKQTFAAQIWSIIDKIRAKIDEMKPLSIQETEDTRSIHEDKYLAKIRWLGDILVGFPMDQFDAISAVYVD
jgi:hypothetical protein